MLTITSFFFVATLVLVCNSFPGSAQRRQSRVLQLPNRGFPGSAQRKQSSVLQLQNRDQTKLPSLTGVNNPSKGKGAQTNNKQSVVPAKDPSLENGGQMTLPISKEVNNPSKQSRAQNNSSCPYAVDQSYSRNSGKIFQTRDKKTGSTAANDQVTRNEAEKSQSDLSMSNVPVAERITGLERRFGPSATYNPYLNNEGLERRFGPSATYNPYLNNEGLRQYSHSNSAHKPSSESRVGKSEESGSNAARNNGRKNKAQNAQPTAVAIRNRPGTSKAKSKVSHSSAANPSTRKRAETKLSKSPSSRHKANSRRHALGGTRGHVPRNTAQSAPRGTSHASRKNKGNNKSSDSKARIGELTTGGVIAGLAHFGNTNTALSNGAQTAAARSRGSGVGGRSKKTRLRTKKKRRGKCKPCSEVDDVPSVRRIDESKLSDPSRIGDLEPVDTDFLSEAESDDYIDYDNVEDYNLEEEHDRLLEDDDLEEEDGGVLEDYDLEDEEEGFFYYNKHEDAILHRKNGNTHYCIYDNRRNMCIRLTKMADIVFGEQTVRSRIIRSHLSKMTKRKRDLSNGNQLTTIYQLSPFLRMLTGAKNLCRAFLNTKITQYSDYKELVEDCPRLY